MFAAFSHCTKIKIKHPDMSEHWYLTNVMSLRDTMYEPTHPILSSILLPIMTLQLVFTAPENYNETEYLLQIQTPNYFLILGSCFSTANSTSSGQLVAVAILW